jgi:putative peptidoglycan lipid II flippase
MTVPEVGGTAGRFKVAFLKLFGGNIFVNLANLGRDVAIATAFGAGVSSDNFFLVISIPVYLIGAGTGAWRPIVVPLLARASVEGRERMEKIAAHLSYLGVVTIVAVSSVLLLMGGLVRFAGLRSGDAKFAAIGSLGLVVVPMYALAAFTEANQGSLQATGRLFLPNIVRAGLPVGLSLGAVIWGQSLGIAAVIPGGTIGAIAGAVMIGWLLTRERLVVAGRPEPLPEPVKREMGLNYRALVTAQAILYISPLVGQWMASSLGPGSVSHLSYANRLTSGIIALVTSSLAPVLLGFYAHRLAAYGMPAVRQPFVEMARAFAWVGCLLTLGVWQTSDFLIGLVYLHGQFTTRDAGQVRALVDCYALTFPLLLAATSANTLIFALSKNRILVPICSALVVANVVGNIVLMSWLGVLGIALSSSLVYALSMLLMSAYLQYTGAIRVSNFEWFKIGLPFLCLGVAAIVPFAMSVRVTVHPRASEVLASIAVLGAFTFLAVMANGGVARALLPSGTSRSG